MRYYRIEEQYENGSGQYLVSVESEDDVKKIIEDEKKLYNGVNKLIEIRYIECTENDYVRFVEQSIIMHAKSYFYKKLKIDGNLSIKEYSKIQFAPGNEAKAVDYYQKRIVAFDKLRNELDLEKLSAKEFLDSIEKLSSN